MDTATTTTADYASIPAMHWSRLRHLATSPRAYQIALDRPPEDTPSMRFGRLVHCLILRPTDFADEWSVWGGQRRAGKAYDAFVSDLAGREECSIDEYRRASDCWDAMRLVMPPRAKELLCEEPIDVECSVFGRRKARPDLVYERSDGQAVLVELKTARSIEPRAFGRAVYDMHYLGQLAWYRQIWERLNGRRLECEIWAVQSDGTDAAVYAVSEADMRVGERLVERLVDLWVECTSSGRWPGVQVDRDTPLALELPRWAYDADGVQKLTFGGLEIEL